MHGQNTGMDSLEHDVTTFTSDENQRFGDFRHLVGS